MIQKKLRLLLLPFLFMAAPSVAAEDGDVVYVNFDRIYRESKVVNAVRDDINVEFRDREAVLKNANDEIARLKEDFEKESLTLSESERETRQRQILESERNFVRDRRALSEDLGLRFQERRRIIDSEISRVITELAKTRKYRMVLNPYMILSLSGDRTLTHNVLLYAEEDTDITDEVVELFDKKVTINR